MNVGKVKYVNTEKGYGFIRQAEHGAPDLFFHVAQLQRLEFDETLKGRAVTFDIEDGPKGPRAARICPAEDAA